MSIKGKKGSEQMNAWHFLPANGQLANGDGRKAVVGQTLTIEGDPVLCEHGLHGSERAIDALRYAPGNAVERVVLGGIIVRDDDKVVASKRTCVAIGDASHVLHRFACWCAVWALRNLRANGRKVDPRSVRAIRVKLQWLRGLESDSELDAARAAVWDAVRAAVWDAARAASAAASAAARAASAAARDAASAAASAAARDARDAVWGASAAARDAASAAARDASAAARDARDAASAAASAAARDARDAASAAARDARAAVWGASAAARDTQNTKLESMLKRFLKCE